MPRTAAKNAPPGDEDLFPVSPLMIFPDFQGDFEIYVEINGLFLLYSKQNERLTEEKKRRLHEDGVHSVYILKSQRQGYDDYVRLRLAEALGDESLPLKERAGVLYNASLRAVEDFFETGLPPNLRRRRFHDMVALVRDSLAFFENPQAMKKMARLISGNYSLFTHSVNVFTLTVAALQGGGATRKTLLNAGVGALTHDMGKISWNARQFERENPRTNALDPTYADPHPTIGAASLASLPLSRESLACVLLHHEREDGRGFPAGLEGHEIPFSVKALSLVNLYDRLTSDGAGSVGMSPFEALRFMKGDLRGAFDPAVYKRVVMMLADAEIT